MLTSRVSVLIVAITACSVGIVAAVLLLASAGEAEEPFEVSEAFSAFLRPPADGPQAAELAARSERRRGDLGDVRMLNTHLGRFNSRLIAFQARGGRNVCYSLVGADAADPAMTYCYAPRDPSAPEEFAGDHFNAVGLEDRLIRGQVAVQLFGVAFDDVLGLRVQVAGQWHAVPLRSNGFYLDLPGASHADLGIVEATLADGSKQSHHMQRGS